MVRHRPSSHDMRVSDDIRLHPERRGLRRARPGPRCVRATASEDGLGPRWRGECGAIARAERPTRRSMPECSCSMPSTRWWTTCGGARAMPAATRGRVTGYWLLARPWGNGTPGVADAAPARRARAGGVAARTGRPLSLRTCPRGNSTGLDCGTRASSGWERNPRTGESAVAGEVPGPR